MRPTVLIVDDHAEFRASASALLESEGFDVIGEAADGEAAISESERLNWLMQKPRFSRGFGPFTKPGLRLSESDVMATITLARSSIRGKIL